MKKSIHLQTLLSPMENNQQRATFFALLCLGIVESLANGLISATDALQLFFHAENCLFVRKELREKTADQIMSHGVLLSDLFDAFPPEIAQREFQHELATIRTLCLKLLEDQSLEQRVAS